MFKSILKMAAATLLFAGIHSLLASRGAKEKAGKLLGERARNGLYRPVYNGLAVATFGAMVFYGLKLPDRELYRIERPLAGLMRSAQIFFVLYMLYGAWQIGFLRFAGFPNLAAFLGGDGSVPVEPEGQGPVLDDGDRIKTSGPFRFSRHPLNFGMLPIIWLMPRMTVNLAVFNVITTIYLVLGSVHEEKRLLEAYGRAYIDYRESGINFFVPSPSRPNRSLNSKPSFGEKFELKG